MADVVVTRALPIVGKAMPNKSAISKLRVDSDKGLTVALASSGKKAEVEHYQKILGIADLVDIATSSDDAERSKPHPDIFEAAIGKLGDINKSEMIVIGDTPYDAEAANKAGLRTVGVLCGGFPEADLSAAGCIAIYKDPQDLLDGFTGSPLDPGR